MSDDLHHLAAAYALDALDVDERRSFEAHFPTCTICTAEVADYRVAASMLADAAFEPPPARLRSQVLAEVSRTRQVSPLPHTVSRMDAARRRRLRLGPILIGAAATIALLVGSVAIIRDRDRGGEFAAIIDASDREVDTLTGEGSGSVVLFWSPSQAQAAMIASDLEAPAEGRAYELWLMDENDVPHAAGVVVPDSEGNVSETMALPLEPAGWRISIEPAGGSPAPTGPVVFTT